MVVKSFGASMSEEKSSVGVLNFLYYFSPHLPSSLFPSWSGPAGGLSPVSCLLAKKFNIYENMIGGSIVV